MDFSIKIDNTKNNSTENLNNESISSDINKENINKENSTLSSDKNKGSLKRNGDDSEDIFKDLTLDESKETISKEKIGRNKNTIEFREFIDFLLQVESCKGSSNSKEIMKELLSDFFIKIIQSYPNDLSKIYYFLNYKLGPSYLTPDLEISFDKLEALVQKIFGVNENILITNLKQAGDLGQVSYDLKKISEEMSTPQSVEKLKLFEIMNGLEEASLENESGKQNRKLSLVYNILSKSDKDEIKFLIRFLEKNLKLGVSKNIILHSLSRAISKLLNKTFEKDVYNILVKSLSQMEDEDILFNHIIELIDKKANFYQLIELCHIRCGVPVNYQMMESTTGVKSMMKAIGKKPFFCEYNYCGIRCQIHCMKDRIVIFNKNFEDISQLYPEIIGYVTIFITKSKEKIKKEIKSFILDCTF